MKSRSFFLLVITLLLLSLTSRGQQPLKVNVENIEIVRDSYGVPNIYAPTDAEAVYGLGWAQCEDNFEIAQENLLTLRSMGGAIKGKEGAATDFIWQLFDPVSFAREHYDRDVSPEVDLLVRHYVAAVNRYAELHPDKVLAKDLYPIQPEEILALYNYQFILMTFAVLDVAKVAQDRIDLYETNANLRSAGSNAMAYNRNKTEDGKTYLVANPHLPTEGPVNFWEVGIHSDEGLNFHGVTFSGGGLIPVIGTNQNLGWTHTVNSDNFSDVYELKMHPNKKYHYQYDGEWLALERKVAKLKVKVGPMVIPIKRKFYVSKYGPTLKNKHGFYAIRSNCWFNLKAVEQWYRMCKSQNYQDFWQALEIRGIPSQTITYADKEGNILHFNNAQMPIRDEQFDWSGILPGNTSKTCWSYDEMVPLRELAYVDNPKSGYVFNSNNTPFDCSGEEDNPRPEDYPASFGYLSSNTARAKRFKELIAQYDKVSFQDVIDIRSDYKYHSSDLNFRQLMNMEDLFTIAEKYPELAEISERLKKWDRSMDIDNRPASIIALCSMYVEEEFKREFRYFENYASEELLKDALLKAEKFLMKHYGTLDVPLGRIQKAVRGKVELPMFGSGQTLANCHPMKYRDGKIKNRHGDTFIMYAKYNDQGLEELRTLNLYGNSRNPKSPNFTDQMQLYVNQQTRPVTLNEEIIRRTAICIYHPK